MIARNIAYSQALGPPSYYLPPLARYLQLTPGPEDLILASAGQGPPGPQDLLASAGQGPPGPRELLASAGQGPPPPRDLLDSAGQGPPGPRDLLASAGQGFRYFSHQFEKSSL